MSDEDFEHQPLDDSDLGRRGNEKAAGYTEMPMAYPAEKPDDLPSIDALTLDDVKKSLDEPKPERPAPVERDFFDRQSGERRPLNETVTAEDAGASLAAARASERAAFEAEAVKAMKAHLDLSDPRATDENRRFVEDVVPLAQEYADEKFGEPEQPQPEAFEPQPESVPEPAQQLRDAVDGRIANMLEADGEVRARISADFNRVTEFAQAHVQQAEQKAAQAVNSAAAESNALLLAQFPEMGNVQNADQLRIALGVLQQQNPQRAAAFVQLAQRAGNIVAAQQQQQFQQVEVQKQQYEAALGQYTETNVKEYEKWTANENAETMKAIRENLKPVVEGKYGVPMQALMDIHNGKTQMGATEFVRSAAFQKMLHDATKWNLAQQGMRENVHRPVPNVQRPGVSSPVRIDESDLALASSKFNLPGGNIGTQGLRNAAALIQARRGKG